MEIRLLRYFLAVAREKNITRAAQSLHITQPSLSKQLIELEQQLGKPLLIRGKRKITLTEEGILLRERANEILMLCAKTEREIAQDAADLSGDISIGGGTSELAAEITVKFMREHPNVHFQFFNGDAEEVMEKLDHGTLDFGILIEPIDTTKYYHHPLGEIDEFGLFMRCDAPLARKKAIEPSDIKNLPLIIPQRVGLQTELSAWSGLPIERLNIIATFNTIFNNPLLLLKKGAGCAFGVSSLIDTDGNSKLCFRPLAPAIKIQHGLVWKHCPIFSKAAQKFAQEIRSAVTARGQSHLE